MISSGNCCFSVIVQELEKQKNDSSCDWLLRKVFFYPWNAWHAELIVRVPQMIAQYDDGLERLEKQSLDLLEYYKQIYLPAVTEHVKKIEDRALSYWPKELFTRFNVNDDECLLSKGIRK